MEIFKNNHDAKNYALKQWLIASVIIPLLAIITTLFIYFLSRPAVEPKFIIANGILKSDATLIIKANNTKANRNLYLDILFDEVPFPQKGILNRPDSKGMYQWSFTLKKYTTVIKLTKDGEHSIKVGFSDTKWSEKFGIIFLTQPPIVKLEKSNVEGQVKIKGNVASEFQVPKNILSVSITYFNDDNSSTINNIPLETKVHPETGITYYVFETVLQGLPDYKQDDIRYSSPFWKVEVKDQAGNKYFHEQSYAKFIAPGCDVVGVGDIANIKIQKISEDTSTYLKNIVRIVPNPIFINKLPNGEPPIDLIVRSQGNKTKLEWSYNIDSIAPLTLIYKDEKQIGASTSNEYIENFNEPLAQFRVEQELGNQIYSSKTKSIDTSFLEFEFTIEKPKNKETIYNKVYNGLQGSFHGRIPPERQLFVFIKDNFGYKKVFSEMTVNHFYQKWYQRNLNFETEGVYDIVVCLSSNEKINVLRESDFPKRFATLPSGMKMLASVKIYYKKENY